MGDIANFHLVFERIAKDKKNGREKDRSTYGKYFIKAVTEDWAGQDNKTQEILERNKKLLKIRQQQESLRDITDKEDIQKLTSYYYDKAKGYIDGLNLLSAMRLCSNVPAHPN